MKDSPARIFASKTEILDLPERAISGDGAPYRSESYHCTAFRSNRKGYDKETVYISSQMHCVVPAFVERAHVHYSRAIISNYKLLLHSQQRAESIAHVISRFRVKRNSHGTRGSSSSCMSFSNLLPPQASVFRTRDDFPFLGCAVTDDILFLEFDYRNIASGASITDFDTLSLVVKRSW
jgi:hypothetical protein